MIRYCVNHQFNGVEIYFDTKPSSTVISELKSRRWRWLQTKKCWYNANTPSNLEYAKSICSSAEHRTTVHSQCNDVVNSNSTTNTNLVECIDCRHIVSIHAHACPFCGCPLSYTMEQYSLLAREKEIARENAEKEAKRKKDEEQRIFYKKSALNLISTEFQAFFDYRTELYDFQQTPPAYEENAAFYQSIGLSSAEEYLLTNYNFALDEKIDAQMLSDIIDYNRVYLGKYYFRYDFYEGLKQYLYRLTHTDDAPWIYLVWMLYGLVFLTGLMRKAPSVLWKLPLLFGMRSISWMFLIMRGRIVDRVTVSLYLTEVLILTAMLLTETYQMFEEYRNKAAALAQQGETRPPYIPQYRKYWPYTMLLLLVTLCVIPIIRNVRTVEEKQEYREDVNHEWNLLRQYFMDNPDNYYLLDVYSTVQYSEKMFVDVDNSYRNYDICGGWAAGSPVYMEKLSKRGIGNIESDLINMNNVYFVTRIDRDMDWFVAYYKSKGYEVRLDTEAVFRIDGKIRFMIYRVRLYQLLG